MKKHKPHNSKWIDLGYSVKERESAYAKLRNKARKILVKNHNDEYKLILKELIKEFIANQEFNKK